MKINKFRFYQKISTYILPLLFLTSLISLGAGSLFDLVFFPFYLFLIFFGLFQNKVITNSIKNLSFIYFFSIFFIVIFKNLFLVKENLIFDYLILSYRVFLPIVLLFFLNYLYKFYERLDEKNKIKIFNFGIIIWNLSMIATCILSIRQFAGDLGFSFPFYAGGNLDRQVFGPAMSFVSITAIVVLLKLKFFQNKFLFFLNYLTFSLSTLCAVGSSSRGSILIYLIFLIVAFPKKLFMRIKKKILFLISLNLTLISFVIYYVYLNFPIAFDAQFLRSLSLFSAIGSPLSDDSRANVILNLITYIQTPHYWILGKNTTLLTPDSGPFLFLANFGLIPFFIFISIFILIIKVNKNIYIRAYLLAALFQFLFSSETIFIPRYVFLINWSFIIMFFSINRSNNNLKDNKENFYL